MAEKLESGKLKSGVFVGELTPEVLASRAKMPRPERSTGVEFQPSDWPLGQRMADGSDAVEGVTRCSQTTGNLFRGPGGKYGDHTHVVTRGDAKAIYFPKLNDYAEPGDVRVNENGEWYIVEEERPEAQTDFSGKDIVLQQGQVADVTQRIGVDGHTGSNGRFHGEVRELISRG